MTSQHSDHEKPAHSTDKRPCTLPSKIQVQRSFSKESLAIHFSAFGKEEEEEVEELCMTAHSSTSGVQDGLNIVTGLETCEEILKEDGDSRGEEYDEQEPNRSSPVSRAQAGLTEPLQQTSEQVSNSPPTKSLSFPSSDKPFFGLIRASLSDIESRDGISQVATPAVRNRTLKTLVKSLSSDPPQDSPLLPHRLPESRLNLQLFKQFAQSRIPTVITSSSNDSKTAPPSPAVSPDNRSFFKVAEVEARIEDTKRRLSEVIYEPLQLLSKIMDEKSSNSLYRPKSMSASTSELASITSVNGLAESNNNYCIKEEEDDVLETGRPISATSVPAESPVLPSGETKSPNKSLLSMSLENCSMSALAKQEYEDFCVLYSEDFENDANTDLDHTEADVDTKSALSVSSESYGDVESECSTVAPAVPYYSLAILTILVYGYFLIPLPNYIGGMLLGIALGFFLAIGAVWLTGPTPSGSGSKHSRYHRKLWDVSRLDIKEPDIYKGWMNEISNYDPETYHATLTHSVYVRLEGSVIRLSKPNHNVPRRATHNQPKPDVTYISQKIYDLTNSKVSLVPQNLARKRVWNKKYPIRIELGYQDDFMSKTEGDKFEIAEAASVRDRDGTGGGSDRSHSASTRDLTLYLFGRTGREKEEWFQRLLTASKLKTALKKSRSALNSHSRSSSRSSLDDALAAQPRIKDSGASAKTSLLDYSVYMASLLPKQETVTLTAASPTLSSPHSSPGADKKLQAPASATVQSEVEDDSVAWLNAALGRIAWDFLSEPYWAELVSKKIQMKLSKIRLPYFMNELTITELDMGTATPRVTGASKPSIDYRGLWFDLDVSYSGSFLMTLETKMNLIRLGKEGENFRMGEFGKEGSRPRTYCLADSDEESSSAGSSDEDDSSELSNDPTGAEGLVGGHKPSKIMRFVDKIAKSKYFQKATETEFIKKKMEEVSNTPLLLTVEVQELRGTLAVNIPPPPTDRIWYGFRKPPHLELKARPKLGEREVTLAHVTDWIEKKLDQEFQKIFVMPNMDDVWLTIMHSAMDQRSYGGASVAAEPEKNTTSQQ